MVAVRWWASGEEHSNCAWQRSWNDVTSVEWLGNLPAVQVQSSRESRWTCQRVGGRSSL